MIRTRYIPEGVCDAELAYNRRMHGNLGAWWDIDTLSHDQSSGALRIAKVCYNL